MNKSELMEAVAAAAGMGKSDVEKVFASLVETVTKTLKSGDDVSISGFGVFTAVKRAERTGRNPRTGEEVKIAAATVPKFKPAKAFKEAF